MRLSVVVPFHRDLAKLDQCLSGLRAAARALPAGTSLDDLIVVADGAVEDATALARTHAATVTAIEGPRGPAVARNHGAAGASGDLIVFVDSDVVASAGALNQLAARFLLDPELAAVFGAYDEQPADPGFVSQGKNLAHSFIHQRSAGDASTFWAGLGAVRAEVFARVGGFDERFARPSVEDIDLGYRIRASGGRILLDPAIQGRHLKRWTLGGAIVTDVRDRGIPWVQLLHRHEGRHDHLNVTASYRACVVVAYILAACLVAAPRSPMLLVPAGLAVLALWVLESVVPIGSSQAGEALSMPWGGSQFTCFITSATVPRSSLARLSMPAGGGWGFPCLGRCL